jgi:bifunctional non-homologous end joining protein LigD
VSCGVAYVPTRASSFIGAHPGLKLPGAKESPALGFIPPQLATLRDAAPAGKRWLFEIKHDGYRAQLRLSEGRTTIYNRRGYDRTRRFT